MPQGFLAGTFYVPTLQIGDIVEAVNSCEIRLFADDIFLYAELETSDSVNCFQADLNILEEWTDNLRVSSKMKAYCQRINC